MSRYGPGHGEARCREGAWPSGAGKDLRRAQADQEKHWSETAMLWCATTAGPC